MYYLSGSNRVLVCFSKHELEKLFEECEQPELLNEMESRGLVVEDLKRDPKLMVEIASVVSAKVTNHRDNHEIFSALFIFSDFYEIGSEVCFVLKNSFNSHSDKILSLNDLNAVREDPPDFIIKSTDGLREFELKRYRGILSTDGLFSFLEKELNKYGSGLGQINLLVILQPEFPYQVSGIDFRDLHSRLKSLKPAFQSHILISYNDKSSESVINQVYPDLASKRIPFILPSSKAS